MQSEREKLLQQVDKMLDEIVVPVVRALLNGADGRALAAAGTERMADYILQREQEAEHRGELYMLKMLQHWQNLHSISIEKEDLQHFIGSLEQYPKQPLSRLTLAALTPKSITPCSDIHCVRSDHTHAWGSSLPKSTEPKHSVTYHADYSDLPEFGPKQAPQGFDASKVTASGSKMLACHMNHHKDCPFPEVPCGCDCHPATPQDSTASKEQL